MRISGGDVFDPGFCLRGCGFFPVALGPLGKSTVRPLPVNMLYFFRVMNPVSGPRSLRLGGPDMNPACVLADGCGLTKVQI